ncbi:MAG: SDR family NAD(P)-dependent oxidoreductase [Planctomycetia bacterium]|nr:SDR family NAD(P)-dependent oxidoreductase [Planctomycetia bacterium]
MGAEYWRGKVALVTGGSAGLGKALAAALVERGAKVVIAARTPGPLEAAAHELRSRGGDVLAVPADVTDDAQVAALLARVKERHGGLDLLVNNAGASARQKVLDTSAEQFREMLDLNFLSAVRCTRAAAPLLVERKGHLVNIGSLASKAAPRFLGAYPASKFALAAYSQQLRLELGPQGLHVLLVCPGPIRRDEVRTYGAEKDAGIPDQARKPGGGAKMKAIAPEVLAAKILRACEKRKPELVIPWKARLLFAIAQVCPGFGDWLLRKMTA